MGFQNKKPVIKTVSGFVLLMLLAFFSVSAQKRPMPRFVTVNSIELIGNTRTHNHIVNRELLFSKADVFLPDEFSKRVNQSRLNLLNTSLFNFVTIDTASSGLSADTLSMNIKISLLERWYIWPEPILQNSDRNFNAWWQSHDLTRINVGLNTKWFNFTGRMDELDAIVQLGKNHRLVLAYQIPYLNNRKTAGIGFEVGYTLKREVGYATSNDKLVYAFSSQGLAAERYFSINTTYRNNIFTTHQLVAGLRKISFSDSLLRMNPDYSYTKTDEPVFFNLYYKLKIDHRDIKYYPLTGWYADLELNKAGIGFKFEKPVNTAWAKTTTRVFAKLAPRWYTGISFIGKVSSSAVQPYFLIEGLGYNRDYVRGYQYNVIDGKHYSLMRSTVKFALIPEREHKIGFIPSPKFSRIHIAMYLTAFADAGYVWQPQWVGLFNNKLPKTLLAGTGIGVDLVTYYDKVVRIEYAINKSGKSSIFIHFVAGI